MSKQFLITIVTLVVIAAAAVAAVYFVKGFTFSPTEGKMVGTGILALSSTPDGASVYIDGHLTTATNTTLSQLQPKTYDVKIIKDGYIPWEKEITVAAGLVSEVKPTLFPALPTIYPLTFNGVNQVLLSPDGQKLAFTVPYSSDTSTRQKGGVWVWTMTGAPISFTRGNQPQQIVASTSDLDFSKGTLRFSPDSTQILATLQQGGVAGDVNTRNYLLPVNGQVSISDLKDITPIVANTTKSWDGDLKTEDQARIMAINDVAARDVASKSAVLKWSPDETKFIAGPAAEKGSGNPSSVPSVTPAVQGQSLPTPTPQPLLSGYKVYDLGSPIQVEPTTKPATPTSNQPQSGQIKEYDLPPALAYYWLPDSKHIIIVMQDEQSSGPEGRKIGIADFDGSNVAVIYAGKFDGTNVFAWPDSSRIAVLTSFATPTASVPNLFGINLK